MPVLNWIGKEKIVNHHKSIPYCTLERKYSYDKDGQHEEDNGSENMIIHGDNLYALKALLPRYEGKIKCIYIDPPYNTGNKDWCYNDNVDSPIMKKWLSDVLKVNESERYVHSDDLTKHDKWLCMMYPRLSLLGKLLTSDGVLIISIGNDELHNLLSLCHELFPNKHIQVVSVKMSGGKPSNGFNISNEYLIFVAPIGFDPNVSLSAQNSYSSPYHGMNLATFTQSQRPNQTYPIFVSDEGVIVGVGKSLDELRILGEYTGPLEDFQFDYSIAPPGTHAVWPVTSKGDPCVWRLIPSRLMNDWNSGFIKVIKNNNVKTGNKYTVQYLSDGIIKKIKSGDLKSYRLSDNPSIPTLEVEDFKTGGVGIQTIWTDKRFYTSRGSEEITSIMGDKGAFPYPKPLDLVQEIIARVSDSDSIILDSFAGSGTTAHAVSRLNEEDGGHRSFILVETEKYARDTTAKRMENVIQGYKLKKRTELILYHRKLTFSSIADGELIYKEAIEAYDKIDQSLYSSVSKPKLVDNEIQIIAEIDEEQFVPGINTSFSFYELGPELIKDGLLNQDVDLDTIRSFVYYLETHSPYDDKSSTNPYFLGRVGDTSYYLLYKKGTSLCLEDSFIHILDKDSASHVVYASADYMSDELKRQYGIRFMKIPRDIRGY